MATGFTRNKATSILKSALNGCYIALSTTTPDQDGNNFTEPATSTGYQRQSIGTLDESISGQVANKNIIFLFEAIGDCGSITHVGASNVADRGGDIFLMAQLTSPLSVGAGYVPLIRAHGFVVGLDKSALDEY